MYHVSFPKLGINNIVINPVLLEIGPFKIMWYGALIGLGFLLAILYGFSSFKKLGLDGSKMINAIIAGLAGGIVGARLYYCIFNNPVYYFSNPLKLIAVNEGGLAIYGGIIGACLAGGIVCFICKINIFAALDIGALGFSIGQCLGRWGNFTNQEAFGNITDLPWGMMSENTLFYTVHPCFLYESLWCALGFVLLHFFTRYFRQYDGQTFLLYAIWYGTGRFFIEALRTDSLYIGVIKVSQLVAVIAVLGALALLIIFRNRTKLSGCGLSLPNGVPEKMLKKEEEKDQNNQDEKIEENTNKDEITNKDTNNTDDKSS